MCNCSYSKLIEVGFKPNEITHAQTCDTKNLPKNLEKI